MLRDSQVPPGCEPDESTPHDSPSGPIPSGHWRPADLARVVDTLAARGPTAWKSLDDATLTTAWLRTVAIWRDPESAERRRLDPLLASAYRLSPEGLSAGMEAVLGGVDGDPARQLLSSAGACHDGRPAVLVLAGNLPGLVVQSLLPALAVRRPLLAKSPSSEPLFAPAFVATLLEHAPALADAVAACTWSGGDRELERAVFAGAGRVVAYGDAATMRALGECCGDRLVAYGPRLSVALISKDVDAAEIAPRLARDIALFDQRGCLSIHAVYTSGDAQQLAAKLTEALALQADVWPPGATTLKERSAVRLEREGAAARGLTIHELELAAGTVIVEREAALRMSPGMRTVRVHRLTSLDQIQNVLTPWADRLQGAALAGSEAWRLQSILEELGVSRCVAPGELQLPNALWHNGGVSPLAALG